jgi:hypothetical protein
MPRPGQHVPWHGRMLAGPNWSTAKQRSGHPSTFSTRSIVASASGAVDSVQVRLYWKKTPGACTLSPRDLLLGWGGDGSAEQFAR